MDDIISHNMLYTVVDKALYYYALYSNYRITLQNYVGNDTCACRLSSYVFMTSSLYSGMQRSFISKL